MYQPSLDLLRQTIDRRVSGFTKETLKIGPSLSCVYRLKLEYSEGAGTPSVVLKVAAPSSNQDPFGPDREIYVYMRLLSGTRIVRPSVWYAGIDDETGHRLLLLEDLADRFGFPDVGHTWTAEEARAILRSYARLHVEGAACLPPARDRAYLLPRYEARLREHDIASMVATLEQQSVWPRIPKISRLWEQTMADSENRSEEVTLLHNDVYPSNVGIPLDTSSGGEGALVDWEMAGWGLAEMDLAYMFTQPFRSERHLDRQAMLDYYWTCRHALEGHSPPRAERQARQRYADAVLALWLVPVAHKVAGQPFAVGTPPADYWEAMFEVLFDRLVDLCEDL